MRKPRIQITCPARPGTRFGNRITALRWQRILRALGCKVQVVEQYRPGACELLLALHAKRSATSVVNFRADHPEAPVVVAITGTDLYRDLGRHPDVEQTLAAATRLIILQQATLDDLTPAQRNKARVIHQSVGRSNLRRPARPREKRVIVAGHVRDVKDPLRTAMAVRNLPAASRIVVHQYGVIIEQRLGVRIRRETMTNPRYRWCGEVARWKLRAAMARGWLLVLSSKSEGGANVLSEAISAELPVLASAITGSIGILGHDYAGYFEVGSTAALRELLLRAERDPVFYRQLETQIRGRSRLVDPAAEFAAWRSMLKELGF